jgi:hypothetical protein
VPYRRHQAERGRGGETRAVCQDSRGGKGDGSLPPAETPEHEWCKVCCRNEEKPVVRVQSDGHRRNVGRRERVAAAQKEIPHRRHQPKRGCRGERSEREESRVQSRSKRTYLAARERDVSGGKER